MTNEPRISLGQCTPAITRDSPTRKATITKIHLINALSTGHIPAANPAAPDAWSLGKDESRE
jgi:hypothetical protein